ncbi:MAG: dTDP-4-dehydrorhamnose reductase [Planctomycetes bacterium]|nr:dTDP-4-dehydrorhamnose reductase [Planctomycetota bacterium]
MKILVTGSDGQLGNALRQELAGRHVTPLGDADIDITSLEQTRELTRRHAPDIVINAAAYTDVDGAEADPESAYRVNAGGSRNLALATAELSIPLLHVSTDYVFDGRAVRPYHEYDRPAPRSVYGASKLAGEEAVRSLNPRHYIVRTAWLYHLRGRNFLRTMISLSSRAEVRVVHDQVGSPTFAPHLARAIGALLSTGAYGTYHFAGFGSASWFELTTALYRALDIRTPVVPVTTEEFPRPAERPRYSVLTTIQDPRILLPPWEEGLEQFARAVRDEAAPGA